jgi:hypothetical protein
MRSMVEGAQAASAGAWGLAPPPSARFAVCHLPRFAGEERS